jgi:hypothetical protein
VLSIDDDVPGIPGDQEYDADLLGHNKPADRTRAVRGNLLDCAVEGVTYLRISPAPHVGAQAATGWELSETSRREDLVESIKSGKAAGTVQRLRDMLDGTEYPEGCTRRKN